MKKKKSYDIPDLDYFARLEHNGRCLSTKYKTMKDSYEWSCENNHVWYCSWEAVKLYGSWCRYCNHTNKKLTGEDMHRVAGSKNGEWLETEYKNNRTQMRWRCECGNIFLKDYDHVRRGQWCPLHNANQKLTLGHVKKYCQNKKGDCLSKTYENNQTKMLFTCELGHKWKAMFKDIQVGDWCPDCSKNKKIDEQVLHDHAESKNGECLIKKGEYKNNATPIPWKCEYAHVWNACPRDVLHKDSWCPYCKQFRTESLCRSAFEYLVGFKFVKCRPEFLDGLELDGYCEKFNIAFEYNGIQHYKYTERFHKNEEGFRKQLKRDKKKADLCKEYNVKLIIIPHEYNFRDKYKLYKFILDELIKIDIIYLM
jgi:hypothetical protein